MASVREENSSYRVPSCFDTAWRIGSGKEGQTMSNLGSDD